MVKVKLLYILKERLKMVSRQLGQFKIIGYLNVDLESYDLKIILEFYLLILSKKEILRVIKY